jgi:hypothetical protein
VCCPEGDNFSSTPSLTYNFTLRRLPLAESGNRGCGKDYAQKPHRAGDQTSILPPGPELLRNLRSLSKCAGAEPTGGAQCFMPGHLGSGDMDGAVGAADAGGYGFCAVVSSFVPLLLALTDAVNDLGLESE